LPLSEVNNDTVKPLVEKMGAAGLKPKTIRNYVQLVEMIVASLTDKDDNPIFPRNWSAKKMNLPVVEKKEQNTPSFTGETVTALVATAKSRAVQMVYILLGASGLRLGEVLGITISRDTILDDCARIVINQKAWRNKIQGFLKTRNGEREVDLHPSVAAILREFIGDRKSGLLFQTKRGKPMCQTNLLKRYLHKALREMGHPRAGFHAFRRFRNTYLRNYTSCPNGLRKFWLGWSGKDMSDHYDKIREDTAFRREVAERVGIGFELPSIVPNVPKIAARVGDEVLS
jgi:integrase